MRISLRQLEVFRTFSRTLSVTETARISNVSQSAVSHTLHQLETEVGVKLFFRSGNRLRMTTEGRALLPSMERIFTQISQFEGQAEAARHLGSGHLTVASLQSIGPWLINEAIGRFLKERQRLRLTLNTFSSVENLDQVRNESADIGFTMIQNDDAGVFLEPLLRSEVIVALPSFHPLLARETLTAADLHNERLILSGNFTVVGSAVKGVFPVERLRRSNLLEINQGPVAIDLVRQGLGIALVHPFGIPLGREGVDFRRFLPTIELRLMMAFSRNKPVSQLVRQFVRDVRGVASDMTQRIAATGLPINME